MNDAASHLHLFLGMKHVRGILLHGPPGIVYSLLSFAPPPSPPLPYLTVSGLFFVHIAGTGKTLMARQIGKMLQAREPKIVNGPGIHAASTFITLIANY